MNIENKTKLDVIEEKLCKEIEWYLSDEIPLKEKQAKLLDRTANFDRGQIRYV